MQVAIQDGAGNYWGGATFNQASIFYNATGGTVAAWTYSTATLVGQLTNGHTYTITARSTDPAGNTGTTTRTFVYDTTAPTVTNVTSTKADGAYPSGTSIPITVTFSENVTVTGTPTLALNSGGTASYSSGSGGSTLTFSYTTANGENSADLDYSATNSLALSGGTIKDAATNNATLTLPAVGGASSIGGQKAIVVDTAQPDRLGHDPGDRRQHLQRRDRSRPTSPARPPTPAARARSARCRSRSRTAPATTGAARPSTRPRSSTTPPAAPSPPGHTAPPRWSASSRTATPTRSPPSRPTPAGNTGTTTRTFVYDTTAPTVTNVTSTKADGAYPSGTLIPVTVTFSENVTVTGTPTLALNSGGTASYSSGSGGSTLTFNYTVGAGDNSADLDYRATNSLALSGGTIKDAATNNATLTLPDGRRRLEHRRPEGDRRRHHEPDRVGHDPGRQRQHLQRVEPARQPRRLLRRHRRLQHRQHRAGRDPGRRRQLLGRRHLQPGLDLLQRHRRHRRRLDVQHRDPGRPADQRPHLHDHRPLDRRGRQHRHDAPAPSSTTRPHRRSRTSPRRRPTAPTRPAR